MTTAAAPSLLARLTRRRRRLRQPEPADMGTAFGMEQWLDERGLDVPLAPDLPDGPNPPKRAWWPRRRQGGASR